MKKFIVLLALGLITVNLSAQTEKQKQLIYEFFRKHDVGKLVQKFGHPTPDHNGISIKSISDNTIYIEAKYNAFLIGSFKCTYRLDIDDNGLFRNFYSHICECPTAKCFYAVNLSKAIEYMSGEGEPLTSDHRAVKIQEEMRDKVLDRFTVSQLVCCALFVEWHDEGYYGKY